MEPKERQLYKLAREGKLPSSLLFVGNATNNPLPLAWKLTAYIHCEQPTDTQACGSCPSCEQIIRNTHPDLHALVPMPASKQEEHAPTTLQHWYSFIQKESDSTTIAAWAEYIKEEQHKLQIGKGQIVHLRNMLQRPPLAASYKTILIWLPEHLHPSATTPIAKSLENATPDNLIFLITRDIHNTAAIIKTHTIPFHIPPSIEPDRTIPPSHEHFQNFATWLRNAYAAQYGKLTPQAEAFHKEKQHGRQSWIVYGLYLLKQTLHAQHGHPNTATMDEEEKTFCQRLGKTITTDQLHRISEALSDLHNTIKRNSYAKLSFMNTSIAVTGILQKKTK